MDSDPDVRLGRVPRVVRRQWSAVYL